MSIVNSDIHAFRWCIEIKYVCVLHSSDENRINGNNREDGVKQTDITPTNYLMWTTN